MIAVTTVVQYVLVAFVAVGMLAQLAVLARAAHAAKH